MQDRSFLIKIIFALVVLALILSLGGIYLSRSLSKTIKEKLDKLDNLETLTKKLSREVQLLNERVPPFIYTGETLGYVIEFENGIKFYFAGATGLTADLQLIGEYYHPEVVFLPIGNIYSFDPAGAAFAANLINPSHYIIPSHYASFPELEEKADQFFEELKKYDLKAVPLEFKAGEKQDVLGIKTEWLGHGHWLFEGPEGTRILVDPEVEYNPDFPKKYQELTQLKKIDLILLTEGHFGSITLSDIRKWGQLFDPIFICPYELGTWLKANFPAYKIIAVNSGAKISKEELLKLGISEGKTEKISDIIVSAVPASHSSSAIPEGLPVQY